jgi:hypothetical protein
MTTPYAMVPQRLPTVEEMLGGFVPARGPAPTPGGMMTPADTPMPRSQPTLQALLAGMVTPFGDVPPDTTPQPTLQQTLTGEQHPAFSEGAGSIAGGLARAAAQDPAGAEIGRMVGLGPAFRAITGVGGAVMGSPPVQALGRALARPAVGVPLALGGSLAATTGETQAPPPSTAPMSRADFDRQYRRLGAAPSLSDAVKAAEESVRGSDAYASLVEGRQTTAAKRMMDQAIAAARARWQEEEARRPGLETAEEARLEQGYQSYRNDLRKQQEDAIKAQDERERAMLNRPFQERYPTTASLLPWASAGLGGTISAAARMRNVGRFNAEQGNLAGRWQTALDDVAGAPNAAGRQEAIIAAQGLERASGVLERRGPRHSMEYAPAIGLAEGAQLLPSVVDYAASTPGSPLRRHVTESMSDPWSVAGRLAQGAGWGLASAKIGQGLAHTMLPRQAPLALGPATTATAQRHGVPPLPPEVGQQSLLDRLSALGGSRQGTPPTPTPPTAPPRLLPPAAGGPAHQRGVTRYRDPASGEERFLDSRGRWHGPRPGGGHGFAPAPDVRWERISAAPLGLSAMVG